jgi:hypothetical protein
MTAVSPFFFAWVSSSQTTFDAGTMSVMDEDIFSLTLTHKEGQVPDLEMVIFNPRVGLLSPGRLVWAWLSYQPPNAAAVAAINTMYSTSYTFPCIIPLFFGELIGVPTNLFAEKITIKLIARSETFVEDKQRVAETLKVIPNYDPLFLDEAHRDEPDALLEGWSSLYHHGRTDLTTSVSDILTGEDGTLTFEQNDAFYNSVAMTLGESPLSNIQVQAKVHWTQRSSGYVAGPDVNVATYTGDTFMSDWPKKGSGLGGGWRVEASYVNDVYKVGLTPMLSTSVQSTFSGPSPSSPNTGPAPDCTMASSSVSQSGPCILSPYPLGATAPLLQIDGICAPQGPNPMDPAPVNRPSNYTYTGLVVPLWMLNCSWTLRYDEKREYGELLVMDITANTQSVLTSPTVEQNTELIKVSAADVGEPLLIYDAWSDFQSGSVGVGQIIFPNDPTTPGGLSYQVAVSTPTGIAGSVEPVFSDIPGTITYDNTVQWASLGEDPLGHIQQMTFGTAYGTGEILLYQEQVFDPNTGGLVDVPGATSYWLCLEPSSTTSSYTEITYVPPATSSDEALPAPITTFVELFTPPTIATGAGTGAPEAPDAGMFAGTTPVLSGGGGGTGNMMSLGVAPAFLGIPIGGTASNVTANNYFPTDRGQQSIQYLICRARARLRLRSRAVKVTWECPFDLVIGASCRKNATLFDPRLPGGVATGKITSYTLTADGQGKLRGHVEIGCSVGYGGVVEAIPGTPEYVTDGTYVGAGVYQQYDGATTAVFPTDINDVSYTAPAYVPYDDGLTFPLNYLPADGGVFSGFAGAGDYPGTAWAPSSPPEGSQAGKLIPAIAVALAETVAEQASATLAATQKANNLTGASQTITTNTGGWALEQMVFNQTGIDLPYVMEANPVSWEILIKPVTNGPFNAAYVAIVTPVEMPEGINLEAPSSP